MQTIKMDNPVKEMMGMSDGTIELGKKEMKTSNGIIVDPAHVPEDKVTHMFTQPLVPNEMIILTEAERVEKRSKEFRKLINQLVVNNLGKRILALDNLEPDKAWEEVGILIQKGVEVGLLHNAKRIQKLEKKITELGKTLELVTGGKL